MNDTALSSVLMQLIAVVQQTADKSRSELMARHMVGLVYTIRTDAEADTLTLYVKGISQSSDVLMANSISYSAVQLITAYAAESLVKFTVRNQFERLVKDLVSKKAKQRP